MNDNPDEPLTNARLFRYLKLESFTEQELEAVFDRMVEFRNRHQSEEKPGDELVEAAVHSYFAQERLAELEEESGSGGGGIVAADLNDEGQALRHQFCRTEGKRIWLRLIENVEADREGNEKGAVFLTKKEFVEQVLAKAAVVDVRRTWPITASMVLVGASVGVITPAMPFVVEQLQLTAAEYGWIVSAFAVAKMAANIPTAILVERHGRHPYMVYSLGLIAAGVGGIGWASSFSELYACRLCTGVGVSLLSGAATLMVTDLSTPRNRASTMAPIMSGFAAGTALGPALGGLLVDSIGLNPTFYLVGVSYLGVAALNRAILKETQRRPIAFPWMRLQAEPRIQKPTQEATGQSTDKTDSKQPNKDDTVVGAVQKAVGQWIPLMQQPSVQSILVMNGFYWFALAGAQMTVLPLLLTGDPWHMTATQVGRVYMGMSLIQIVGNPAFARVIDKIGKAPAIVGGCTLIALPMATLPLTAGADALTTENYASLAAVLGVWAVGSSMMSTAPLAYLSDKVKESERAQAIALLRTCGDVGFLVGASAIGALADWTGSLEHAMQASAGLLLCSTTWFGARQVLNRAASAAAAAATASKKHD